jgi:hypothetical protein
LKSNQRNNSNPPKNLKEELKDIYGEVQTYMINQAKFRAAEEFCKDRRLKFRILTEDHLT